MNCTVEHSNAGRRNAELESSWRSARTPSRTIDGPAVGQATGGCAAHPGRGAGGQVGHRGETLGFSGRKTVEHRPRQCRGCLAAFDSDQVLGNRRPAGLGGVPAKLKWTEHRIRAAVTGVREDTRGESQTVRSGVQ